jgi:CRP-like cAMP-binding protein
MVNVSDLMIPVFQDVPQELLSKLVPIATLKRFGERETIYSKSQSATHLCIVKSGKALCEYDLSPTVTASISTLRPGYFFGWSALVPGGRYRTNATSADPSEVILLPGADMIALLAENAELGQALYSRMYRVLVDRLYSRTDKFLKVLTKHPDLREVIEG